MKRKRMVVLLEFFQSQNPVDIENKIRSLMAAGEIPSAETIMVAVDHKNLQALTGTIIRDAGEVLHPRGGQS